MHRPAISRNEHQLAQLRALASFEKDPAKRLALFTEINSLLEKKEEQMQSLRAIQLKKSA
jgi:hypothetical protein